MIYGQVSAKQVISKIVRDLDLGREEIPYQDFIEWMVEALKAIGSYYQFHEKETTLEIKNYRADLPCDFHKLIRLINEKTNARDVYNKSIVDEKHIKGNEHYEYQYNVQNNTILTNYKTGKIRIQYLAFPIDEDKYPLVPDDRSFADALFWYVCYKLAIRGHKFMNPQMGDIGFTSNQWHHYCKQARGNANMPDVDGMERIKNIWLRYIPSTDDYNSLFSKTGRPENANLNGTYL